MQKEGIDLKNCLYVHGGHEEKESWQECGHFLLLLRRVLILLLTIRQQA